MVQFSTMIDRIITVIVQKAGTYQAHHDESKGKKTFEVIDFYFRVVFGICSM